MSKLRILCTADLHLGRSSAVAHVAPGIDLSAVGAWGRIVEMAVIEEADAVVIAGDLFDGPGAYLESRGSFLSGLRLLDLKQIPVIAVTGNHDWNVLPLVAREAPKNFHLLGKGAIWERKRIRTKNGDAEFVGWSFASERVMGSQLAPLEQLAQDCPIIGLVHGDTAPDSVYHPISDSDLKDKADFWIVGHVHKSGWIGKNSLYPGSPQALDFGPGERGCHGIRWLEFEAGSAAFSDIVPISNVIFEVLDIDIDLEPDRTGWESALDFLQRKCLDLCRENPATETVHIRARVVLRGEPEEQSPIGIGVSTFLDKHSIEIVSMKIVQPIDPWSLKDLRDFTGEAARLLIGARALIEEEIKGPEIPVPWIEDARKLVERSSKDIEFQFQRTMATVSDQGESAISPLSQEELFGKAHAILVDELQKILEEAVN